MAPAAGPPGPAAVAGTPLDPHRDEARRLLQEELDSGTYQLQESLVSRVWRWFTDLLPDLTGLGPMPSWVTWAVLATVIAAALAVVAFATRDRWRTGRLGDPGAPGAVLEGRRRPAAEHRAAARAALASGDDGTALLEAYRAVAASAVERALLEDRAGSTAHEVALALAPVFPAEAGALADAADGFDAVRYGGRPASESRARAVVELDDRLQRTSPVVAVRPQGPTFPVPR